MQKLVFVCFFCVKLYPESDDESTMNLNISARTNYAGHVPDLIKIIETPSIKIKKAREKHKKQNKYNNHVLMQNFL